MRPNLVRRFVPLPGSIAEPCLADELLDRFFNSPTPSSFKECYVRITGDDRVTGRIENCDRTNLRESLDSTSWTNALGNAVSRRMVQEFRNNGRYDAWRNLVKIRLNVPDFRNQQLVRFGGYGDMPTVNERGAYLGLPSPADESSSYAMVKRGGTDTITLEMVKNDDLGAIRTLPKRLAQAAQRTLAHFVLDFLSVNPVIYDGIPLFHASHGNLASAPLSASGLSAAVAAMKKQTELGSGDRLGIEPSYLFCPVDLEETARNLFLRGTNQDKTFVQNLKIEVVPVWYWSDANDWCVSGDPVEMPTIEVGFLDETTDPEMFIQDLPTVGSLFTNDQTTFKVRHIYSGAVIDYRGIYKSVV